MNWRGCMFTTHRCVEGGLATKTEKPPHISCWKPAAPIPSATETRRETQTWRVKVRTRERFSSQVPSPRSAGGVSTWRRPCYGRLSTLLKYACGKAQNPHRAAETSQQLCFIISERKGLQVYGCGKLQTWQHHKITFHAPASSRCRAPSGVWGQ